MVPLKLTLNSYSLTSSINFKGGNKTLPGSYRLVPFSIISPFLWVVKSEFSQKIKAIEMF